MSQADEGIGNRGADICTHDHGYCGMYVQATGNQPDDDGRDCAGALHQRGGKDAEDETHKRVGSKRKKLPGTLLTTARPFETRADKSD